MIYLLGKTGQLGRAFAQTLDAKELEYRGFDSRQLDLSRPSEWDLDLGKGDLLINCGAYTQVDAAEKEESLATQINGDAPGHLARMCSERGARFVHFSTDYVFDGQVTQPYEVDHPRDPINAYGRSKAVGERAIEEVGGNSLLIRTSWVYAPWGKNFVLTMRRLMQERDALKIVDDQRGRPTHVMGLAERTLGLLDEGATGTFHVTDAGDCTWYGFAQAIRTHYGLTCELSPCMTTDYPLPAARPAYSVLSTRAVDGLLGEARHFTDWLATC